MIARILRRAAVGIAASGLLAPTALLSAAEPAATVAPAMVSDVALGGNGSLRGQVVNAAGAAVAGVNITVRQQETVIAKTSSGPDGKFEVVGLPGGVFRITTDQSEASVRLWATETAPPGARSSVLVVHDQAAVRGQSALGRMLSRPLAIAALVATAVAVPVVVHQIDVDRKSGS